MKGSTKFYLGIGIFLYLLLLISVPIVGIILYLLYSIIIFAVVQEQISREDEDEPYFRYSWEKEKHKGKNYWRNWWTYKISIITIILNLFTKFNKFLDKKL